MVDDSNDHVLSVWDWQREERQAEVKVGQPEHNIDKKRADEISRKPYNVCVK